MMTVVVASPKAQASLTGFDNHASFEAAAGPTTLNTFESFASGTPITTLPGITSVSGLDSGGTPVGVFVTSDTDLPFAMFTPGTLPSETNFLSNDLSSPTFATGSITFTLASPATAIGAFVADGAPLGDFSIEVFNGTTSLGTITVGPRTLPDSFVGVVSTEAFTSARFFSVNTSDSWGLDNLEFSAATPAVPEPSSLAVFATLGVLGLVGARRWGR